jgi:translation initiation factor 1
MKAPAGNLVYTTDRGRICPGCLRPVAECVCKDRSRPGSRAAQGTDGKNTGKVRLRRETKGRKGAGVTLIEGLLLADAALAELARDLKARCGVGGSIKDGVIELQGNQREKIKPWLEAKGFVVVIAGG